MSNDQKNAQAAKVMSIATDGVKVEQDNEKMEKIAAVKRDLTSFGFEYGDISDEACELKHQEKVLELNADLEGFNFPMPATMTLQDKLNTLSYLRAMKAKASPLYRKEEANDARDAIRKYFAKIGGILTRDQWDILLVEDCATLPTVTCASKSVTLVDGKWQVRIALQIMNLEKIKSEKDKVKAMREKDN